MNTSVEIILDEQGNKKSVLMPYALYEQLIQTLAAHDESLGKVMRIASLMVESQQTRVESKSSPQITAGAAPPAVSHMPDAPVQPIDPKQDLRSYQRARGYFTETGGFWVLAGSIARFNVSNAFESIESLVTLRRKLIDEGVLASDPNYPDYIFTRDCYFSSASTAACIIDGNARNNPAVWKKR